MFQNIGMQAVVFVAQLNSTHCSGKCFAKISDITFVNASSTVPHSFFVV